MLRFLTSFEMTDYVFSLVVIIDLMTETIIATVQTVTKVGSQYDIIVYSILH
jgi:hypothetical protein